jgi:hypothetical protein
VYPRVLILSSTAIEGSRRLAQLGLLMDLCHS